ncbi:MAG: alpha-ketoglutarate-dependent dioxygenase AlkB [Bacteroidetes bacterium]|nr:MAG: alpha-ketoglutarate-dependent dioxygenase AlkB [Bacteroidota bacterium]
MDLFDQQEEFLELEGGYLRLFRSFLSAAESDRLFHYFIDKLKWEQSSIRIFGKTHLSPRLEAYYSLDPRKSYAYSGKQLTVHEMDPELNSLLEQLNTVFDHDFNAVLANLYRDGKDSNGWHADDEPELGPQPQIASISLGASRDFQLKPKKGGDMLSLQLDHGSLLWMGGKLQQHWKHQLPKRLSVRDARINLTFRKVY